MRSVEFLNVEIEGAGALGKIPFDPFLAAVASLKTTDGKALVSHWINPDPAMSIVEDGAFKMRDAANATVFINTSTANPLPAKTTAINGKSTITVEQAVSLLSIGNSGGGVGVNADEWSLIAVCNLRATNGDPNNNQRIFGLGGGSLVSGSLWPVLEVSGNNNIAIREGGTSAVRAQSIAGTTHGVPLIAAGSFSVEQGIATFKNNLENLNRNESDKRPLTMPDFSFMGDRGGNLNAALGDFGMAFALRADISKPEYSAARDVLIGGLMDRYGIV